MKPAPSIYDGWSEATFQNKIEGFAIRHGWLYFHPFDSRRSRKGYPDLTLVHPERALVVWAELKSATGKVSPDQQRWLEGLTQAGGYVYLWFPRHWPAIQDLLSGVTAPRRPVGPAPRPARSGAAWPPDGARSPRTGAS